METKTSAPEFDTKTPVITIIGLLEKNYPNAKTALKSTNPLEILVATILSAQCTDKRVNIVTKSLFKKYRTVEDYANADLGELEEVRVVPRVVRGSAQVVIPIGAHADVHRLARSP